MSMDNIESEIWMTSVEKPNYEISNFGNIRRKCKYGYKEIKGSIFKSGDVKTYKYYQYVLPDKRRKNVFVHREVALLFVENPDPTKYLFVDHIDRNKLNNHYKNLRWCNTSQNAANSISQKNSSICKNIYYGKKSKKFVVEFGNSDIYVHKKFDNIGDALEFRNETDKMINKDFAVFIEGGMIKPIDNFEITQFKNHRNPLNSQNL